MSLFLCRTRIVPRFYSETCEIPAKLSTHAQLRLIIYATSGAYVPVSIVPLKAFVVINVVIRIREFPTDSRVIFVFFYARNLWKILSTVIKINLFLSLSKKNTRVRK